MKLNRAQLLLITCIVSISATPNLSRALSLSDYIAEVEAKNGSVSGSTKMSQGSKQAEGESNLLFLPRLFGEALYSDDRRQTANPNFQGRQTLSRQASLGVENNFRFGLSSRLYYSIQDNAIQGLSPIIFAGGSLVNVNTGFNLELTQPLYRNGFGSEARANAELLQASNEASIYGDAAKRKQALATAENAYTRLWAAREILGLQEDLLDRAEKIYSWAKNRAAKNLSDSSDALQAEATYQQRQVEIVAAQDEARSAMEFFNITRGQAADEPVAALDTPLLPEAALAIQRSKASDQIKTQEASAKVIKANATLSKERAKPTVDLFARAGMNGVNTALTDAMSTSTTLQYPYYAAGIRFTMPLALGEASDVRAGRVKQELGADESINQLKRDEEQQFSDLKVKLSVARKRIELLDKLESIQRRKLAREKERLNLGRTTTYQVLLFDQDYAQARLLRTRTLSEAFQLYSQLKTLGDNYDAR
jgi:outer membrane protein TolC